MATVTFILGFCGSGKSHLADQMGLAGAKVFDEGFAAPGQLDRNAQSLVDTLRAGTDCVVVEIAFCYAPNRDWVVRFLEEQVPHARIEWIAFQADLTTANENCRRRMNKGEPEFHISINNRLAELYTIPTGVPELAIYSLSD